MKKKMIAISAAAALLVVLTACPVIDTEPYGSLILNFNSSTLETMTITPDLDMAIDYYNVDGQGPNSSTFTQSSVTGTTIVESALAIGSWLVTVNAYNVADDNIGTGNVTVLVEAGQTATDNVAVGPVPGDGFLNITVNWPPTALVSGTVAISLSDGATTITPDADPSVDLVTGQATSSYTGIASGYYSLIVQLRDGGALRWGSYEAVRILFDQTTAALFDVTATELDSAGGINITIIPDLQNPFDITFTDNGTGSDLVEPATITQGGSIDITAVPTVAVTNYDWYVDGELIQTGGSDTFFYGDALAVGSYRVDVGATSGAILSSETFTLVVDAP